MREIRCFISSPGDVGQERVVAVRVIERLAGEYSERLRLTPVVWEHEPLRATEHFQTQIIPPSQTDIVICILWSRLGTRLPEQFQRKDGTTYSSGTEWEFEDAIESYRARGTPDLLVYRKTSEAMASLKSKEQLLVQVAQKEALDKFIDRWFGNPTEGFRAAFHNFDSADEFERLLEHHLRRFLEEHVGTLADQLPGFRPAIWHRGTPFRGLKPFDIEHAPVFCGRTRAISELKTQLARQAAKGHGFVLVVGMSGSGKSSLVRAGLLPTLIVPGVVEGVGLWRWAIIRPNDAPESLHAMLGLALNQPTALPTLGELGFHAKHVTQLLESHPHLVVEPIGATLANLARQVACDERLSRPPAAKLLIVIDQLEEIFAPGKYSDEQLRSFAHAVTLLAQSGHVWFVATLRSDYFSHLSRVPEWISLKSGDGQYDLLPPSISEIEQIIQFPARAAGIGFEVDPQTKTGLDKVLLESAARSPESLPLLEFTLDELYKRRHQDVLTFEAYRQLGGLEGAIAQRADEVLYSLPADVQQELPHLFRACITVAPMGEHTASAARVPLSHAAANPRAAQLIEAFVEARLLVTDRDTEGTQVIGLAHEALLRYWPRLTQWLDQNREFFRIRSQVDVAANTWEASQRSRDYLLAPGKPLIDAESLLQAKDQLSPAVLDYVTESSRQARRQSRQRWIAIAAIAGVFLLLVSTFAVYYFAQWQKAEGLKKLADKKRDEAIKLRSEANEQRDLAVEREKLAKEKQLEAEDARRAESHARDAEKDALQARTKALEQVQAALNKADFNLGIRNALIADVQWSQNELTSARALLEQTPAALRRWEWFHVNRKCHQESFSRNLGRAPNAVAMSPQGSRLAVALKDFANEIQDAKPPSIEIWDWIKREKICELTGALVPIDDLCLVGKGEQAVSWGGNELLVWNVASQGIERRIEIAAPEIGALNVGGSFAAFGYPQGSDDQPAYSIEVWDVGSGVKRAEWTHEGRLGQAIAISSDGSRVVVAQGYSGLVVFEVGMPDPIFDIAEPESTTAHSTIFSLAISEDNNTVAVGKYSGDLHAYSLDESRTVRHLYGHENAIVDVQFGVGQQLVSSSWDATVHVWNYESGQETSVQRGHENWVVGAALSASGNTLASVSKDGQLKLWDLRPESSHTLFYHRVAFVVDALAWSQKSKKWLAAVDGASLINGELATKATFSDDSLGGRFLARAPEAKLFATAAGLDAPNKILLYGTPQETRFTGGPEIAGEFVGLRSPASCGVFWDAQILVVGTDEGTVHAWDTATHTELWTANCSGHVAALELDPDQKRLLAGCGDQLWAIDIQTGEPQALATCPGPILALARRPMGSLLAVATRDPAAPGSIQLFDLSLNQSVGTLKGHTDAVRAMDFVPDGSRLASGGDDRSIKIWDVDAQLEAISLWGHQREITALSFNPEGIKLASGDRMGTVIVWDATPPEPDAAPAPVGN